MAGSQPSRGFRRAPARFLDGRRMFDGRPVCTAPSPRGGEDRWVSVGELDNEIIAVVWTRLGTAIRTITEESSR